jgi:hypothetical protein
MKIMPISLGFSSNPGRAPAAGSARLLNCYAENAGKEQKSEWQIWAAPGLSEFARSTIWLESDWGDSGSFVTGFLAGLALDRCFLLLLISAPG